MRLRYLQAIISVFTIIFSFTPFLSTSVSSQEQMTDIRGDPCCYDVREVISFGDSNYALAKDDQDRVEIYKLENSQATKVFSNHQEDKTYLYMHGKYKHLYFLIYNDRVETFSFKTGEHITYSYPDLLHYEDFGEEIAFIFIDRGFFAEPLHATNEATVFFNLNQLQFDTLDLLRENYGYCYILDSILVYEVEEQTQDHLYAYNLNDHTNRKIYSSQSSTLDIQLFYEAIIFYDSLDIFITRGTSGSTYSFDGINRNENDFSATLLNDSVYFYYNAIIGANNFEFQMYQYDLKGNKHEEFSVQHSLPYNFNQLQIINEDKFLLKGGFSDLIAVDATRDTIFKIDEYKLSDYEVINDNVYYFKDHELHRFNFTNFEKQLLTGKGLNTLLDLAYVSDNFFYLTGYNEYGELGGLFTLDLIDEKLSRILYVDEYYDGIQHLGTLTNTGSTLFLTIGRNDFLKKLRNGSFVTIAEFQRASNLILIEGEYYILGKNGTLYKWLGNDNWGTLIDNLPVSSKNLIKKTNDKFFIEGDNYIIQLNIPDQSYRLLRPSPDHQLNNLRPLVNHPDYFIRNFIANGNEQEIWLYDIAQEIWRKVMGDDEYIQLLINHGFYPEIQNDHLIWFHFISNDMHVLSMDMKTMERDTLLTIQDHEHSSIISTSILTTCKEEIFLYYYQDDKQLWVTNGLKSGTRKLSVPMPSQGYNSFYHFEGRTYFTAIGDSSTTVYSYDCNNGTLKDENWTQPITTQGQYRLKDQVYTVGVSPKPEHKLTLAKVDGSQIQAIKVSPNDKGFSLGADGTIHQAIYTKFIADSHLAISGSFDHKGEELWFLHPNGEFERMTDLNPGIYDAEINRAVVHDGYFYFFGYQYGVGKQVWRIQLEELTNVDHPVDANTALTLSPNPVNSQLRISNLSRGIQNIHVYNSAGRQIDNVIKTEGKQSTTLNVAHYADGIYFIQVVGEHEQQSAVFVKGE